MSMAKHSSNRREFNRALALLAAAPLAATASASAADPTGKSTPTATAEALMEIVRLRHGKQLSAEQLKAIQRSIERSQRSAGVLKQFKLTNADEPAFVFHAELP
jgi:ferric-dicitrate binding protein FerR (iron transport regulator)